MESNIGEIIKSSLENIKEIAGVNTIIGEAINTPDGTVIIPVSRVSLGFVSGGIDYNGKEPPKDKNGTINGSDNEKSKNYKPKNFGGGGGTGVTISPIGFLVVHIDGTVDFLNIACPEIKAQNNLIDSITTIIEKSPEIILKIKSIFNKEKQTEDDLFGDEVKEEVDYKKVK